MGEFKKIGLLLETGEYLIDRYGTHYAIGFRGGADFIRRSQNFLINRGICHTPMNFLNPSFGYVTTTFEKLEAALIEQFFSDIVLNKLVPNIPTVSTDEDLPALAEIDEPNVKALAQKYSQHFIAEYLVNVEFMKDIDKNGIPEYSIS